MHVETISAVHSMLYLASSNIPEAAAAGLASGLAAVFHTDV